MLEKLLLRDRKFIFNKFYNSQTTISRLIEWLKFNNFWGDKNVSKGYLCSTERRYVLQRNGIG